MKTVEFGNKIRTIVAETMQTTFGNVPDIPDLVVPPENIDAEYALPCFTFAPILRESPVKIASTLVSQISAQTWLQNVNADGPYVNFKIKDDVLYKTVISEILENKERFGHTIRTPSETILVEYSSPNTNKPLHLGHIRNNVLGMAIVNLLQAAGHRCIPATILNDRGIHICKAMVAYEKYAHGQTPSDKDLKGDQFVGKLYVMFETAVKDNPGLMDEARQMLRDWENGDAETLKLWEKLNTWVKEGFDETYKKLGSRFELVQQESDTYLLGKDIVSDGLNRHVFYAKDDSSVWVDLTEYGLDEKAVLRKDGTSLYITQDLGVAVERFNRLDIDRAIYVVGSEQIYHFQALFHMIKKLGYSWADRCEHLSYGMVYLPEGKMKSREGKVVDADNLIEKMQAMSKDVMESSRFQLENSQRKSIAEAIGIAAIKYYILSFNPQKDIHFDPVKSLSFEGATGAYIQYCHARIHSVLRKANWNQSQSWDSALLRNREELTVIRSLLQYPEIIRKSSDELNPSRLATHLWDIAKQFNTFYTRHRILDCGDEALSKARQAMAAGVAYCLKSGLNILGIKPVERM
jgi:arginyl-tRNA synthetase